MLDTSLTPIYVSPKVHLFRKAFSSCSCPWTVTTRAHSYWLGERENKHRLTHTRLQKMKPFPLNKNTIITFATISCITIIMFLSFSVKIIDFGFVGIVRYRLFFENVTKLLRNWLKSPKRLKKTQVTFSLLKWYFADTSDIQIKPLCRTET